jgi:hypothetical protein
MEPQQNENEYQCIYCGDFAELVDVEIVEWEHMRKYSDNVQIPICKFHNVIRKEHSVEYVRGDWHDFWMDDNEIEYVQSLTLDSMA